MGSKTKEVVKGDSENFVKNAEAADKKPVQKKFGKKNKKNFPKKNMQQHGDEKSVTNNSNSGEKTPDQKPKKPITRAQIAEKKFGVESTWRPFESFFKNKDEEKK